ncbi:MAG: aminopeptidase, partial [Elusimicrobia bacterium]|nr:aminopeptidase [Elusimicrobiota bacterium]
MSAKKNARKSAGEQLEYNNANGYDKFSPAEAARMESYCAAYMDYLGKSKTERQAHDRAVELLEAAGFRDIDELALSGAPAAPGDKLYRSCAGKTLAAFVLGKQPLEQGMRLVGGHTDAPRIDVKQNPLYETDGMALLDTHYYGGIKKYQWVTIPLAMHGVFIKPDGKKITVSIGENPADPVFFISDILPHLGQEQAKKSLGEGITGENLDVIVGSMPVADKNCKHAIKRRVLEELKKRFGVNESDFMSAELEFVPAGQPREAGFDRSMILGYGQDDRVCAYAALQAMLDLKGTPEYTACVLLCDKEEVGSQGATGMQSNFFENTIAELMALANGSYDGLAARRAMARSKMLSADVNAIYDPLYPSVFEKKNAALLNHGTTITKFTGARGKSGANDANPEFVAE